MTPESVPPPGVLETEEYEPVEIVQTIPDTNTDYGYSDEDNRRNNIVEVVEPLNTFMPLVVMLIVLGVIVGIFIKLGDLFR